MPTSSTRCTAPCEPPCTRPAVADGHCAGHYKRARLGQPVNTPLATRPASPMVVVPVRLPPTLKAAVEVAATRRGIDASTAHREALELWLSTWEDSARAAVDSHRKAAQAGRPAAKRGKRAAR